MLNPAEHAHRLSSSYPMFAGLAALGIGAGAAAQLLRQQVGGLGSLGGGTAFWVTIGFLGAQYVSRARRASDGSVWAWAALAAYLMAWLVSYCAVFGLQQSGGFAAAFVHERPFFIAAPVASLAVGVVAACSWSGGWLGDACVVLPIAWSLPEAIRGFTSGWSFALLAGLPTIVLGAVPFLCRHRRVSHLVAPALAIVAGGAVAYGLLRLGGHF